MGSTPDLPGAQHPIHAHRLGSVEPSQELTSIPDRSSLSPCLEQFHNALRPCGARLDLQMQAEDHPLRTIFHALLVVLSAAMATAQEDQMTEFATGVIEANGITFHYLEAGEGPTVLALHGFPDHARSYRHQMPALAAAGYRVVVPYLRGYAPTEIPEAGYFGVPALAA